MNTLRRVENPEPPERRPIQEEMNDPNWEPRDGERAWYRHSGSGNRGYLCRRNGKQMIRLDRPMDPMAIEPFSSAVWLLDREDRPLTALQTTRIAYDADQALCKALGLYAKRKEWLMLDEKMRIAWKKKGPKEPDIRAKLYKAVRDVLMELEG